MMTKWKVGRVVTMVITENTMRTERKAERGVYGRKRIFSQ